MAELDQKRIEDARRGMRFFWYGTRRGRRGTVVLGGVALATLWTSSIVCWFLAPSDTAMWTTFALMGAGLMIYLWVFAVLAVASGGVVGMADGRLDERQLTERRRVYALAHRGTSWMLGISLVVSFLLMDDGDHVLRIPTAALFMFLMAAWTTHMIMPHLVAGWRLPDPPPDDDEA
ncbi:hypothetical protein OG589_23550 [Sphaerisporangium sp. NBC_01403]|uniref:hypothetical protein n=1 Tax=Sphaerisporangium sp. NBC_01403 TaxID=2903599 RepID=UPI003244D672